MTISLEGANTRPTQPVQPTGDADLLNLARGPYVPDLDALRQRPIPGVRTPDSSQTPPQGNGSASTRR